MDSPDDPIPLTQAITIVRELGEALGGHHKRCVDVVVRAALRSRRISSTNIAAVGAAVEGAQHFVRAREEIDQGLKAINETTRAIASEARQDDDESNGA